MDNHIPVTLWHSNITPGKTPINERLFWATQRLSQQAAIKAGYDVHCTVFKISDMFIGNKMMSSVSNLVLKSEISGGAVVQQLPDKSWEAVKLSKRRLDRKVFINIMFYFFNIIRRRNNWLQNFVMTFWKKMNENLQQALCLQVPRRNQIWQTGNWAVGLSVRQTRVCAQ